MRAVITLDYGSIHRNIILALLRSHFLLVYALAIDWYCGVCTLVIVDWLVLHVVRIVVLFIIIFVVLIAWADYCGNMLLLASCILLLRFIHNIMGRSLRSAYFEHSDTSQVSNQWIYFWTSGNGWFGWFKQTRYSAFLSPFSSRWVRQTSSCYALYEGQPSLR
eukprot:133795_1